MLIMGVSCIRRHFGLPTAAVITTMVHPACRHLTCCRRVPPNARNPKNEHPACSLWEYHVFGGTSACSPLPPLLPPQPTPPANIRIQKSNIRLQKIKTMKRDYEKQRLWTTQTEANTGLAWQEIPAIPVPAIPLGELPWVYPYPCNTLPIQKDNTELIQKRQHSVPFGALCCRYDIQ
jgi:hypothetical protein